MENTELNGAWDFVEKYYPNYSTCDEIAYNDDLQKIVDEEYEEGSEAEGILDSITDEITGTHPAFYSQEYINELIDQEVLRRLKESTCEIYERAIEGYINSLKQ